MIADNLELDQIQKSYLVKSKTSGDQQISLTQVKKGTTREMQNDFESSGNRTYQHVCNTAKGVLTGTWQQ